MSDPVTATIAGVAAISSLAAGGAQAMALKSQAKEADYNARNMELEGRQASAQRREDLNRSIAAINTIRAGRNVASGSPTDMAIRSDLRRRSRATENAEQLSYDIGIVGQKFQASQARQAAPWAVLSGIGDAAARGYSLAVAGG